MSISTNTLFNFNQKQNSKNIAFGASPKMTLVQTVKAEIGKTLANDKLSDNDLFNLFDFITKKRNTIRKAGGINLFLSDFPILIDAMLGRVHNLSSDLIEKFVKTFSVIKIDRNSPVIASVQKLKEKYYELGGENPNISLKFETNFASRLQCKFSPITDLSADQQELVDSNRGLIVACFKKFLGYPVQAKELESVGYEGLVRAAKCYVKEKGDFSKFASICIENQLKTYINRNCYNFKTSVKEHYLINKFEIDFFTKHHRYPSYEEISQALNITVLKVKKVLQEVISLEELAQSIRAEKVPEFFWANSTPRPDDIVANKEATSILIDSLSLLDDKELYVIESFFGLNGRSQKTLYQIAKELKMSKKKAWYIKQHVIEKLKMILISREVEV